MSASTSAAEGAVHVAVIGAGVYGVSTALWLARDGARVTLIDRVPPGDPAQTSYGNGGVLARAAVVPVSVPGLTLKLPGMLLDPDSPLFMRWGYAPRALPWLLGFLRAGRRESVARIAGALAHLVGDSVEQHRAIAAGTPAAAFLRDGDYIYMYRDREEFGKDAYGFSIRAAHGFDWDERDRARLLADDPALGPTYGFGAAIGGHGWVVDPGGYVAALAEAFARLGGVFLRAEVQDLRPDGQGVAVVAGGQTLRFDKAVLSAGAWSTTLAARLGVKTRMESERGYHLALRGANIAPPAAYMLADSKFVVTPMERDGAPFVRLAGLVEVGGLEAGPSAAPIAYFKRRIKRLYPSLTWESEDVWLGHRPSTVDSLPLLGECAGAKGVYCAFGAQHVGLTTGPKAGRLVADLIMGRRPNIDMAPYRPDRFS